MNELLPACGLMAIVTAVALFGKWVGRASYYAELQRRLNENATGRKDRTGREIHA